MITNSQVLMGLAQSGAQVKETIDSRTPIQKFRKMGLYRLLKANGHEVKEDWDMLKMQGYAQAFWDQLDLNKVEITPDGFGGFHVRKPAELVKEEQAYDAKFQDEKKQFEKTDTLTLKKVAADEKVDVHPQAEKNELVNAIVDKRMKAGK